MLHKLEHLKVGLISPHLANIFLHYVLDVWFYTTVTSKCPNAELIRYCDDFIACFKSKSDAEYFLNALTHRFDEFGLKLAIDKTRLIEFNPNSCQYFSFLGFNIAFSNNNSLLFTTSHTKLNKQLTDIECKIVDNVNLQLDSIINIVNCKLNGLYNYYGIETNYKYLYDLYFSTIELLHTHLCNTSLLRSHSSTESLSSNICARVIKPPLLLKRL